MKGLIAGPERDGPRLQFSRCDSAWRRAAQTLEYRVEHLDGHAWVKRVFE